MNAKAAIGIPTYKRRDKLARLLESLRPSLAAHGAPIIVADNGCQDAIRVLTEEFAASTGLTAHYVPVRERGISANRNALIAKFLELPGNPEWLAMLDDDLTVPPDWLTAMLSAAESYQGSIVSAPYAMVEPTGNFIIDQSVFLRRERRQTGPTDPVYAGGNFLIARALLEASPPLRFNNDYGLSGGEDYDFFGKAAARGARFVWCDEAFAVEDVDVDRLSSKAVFYRYFSSGNYMGRIDLNNDGAVRSWIRHLGSLARSGGKVALGAATLNRHRALDGVLYSVLGLGSLSALVGFRLYRYK